MIMNPKQLSFLSGLSHDQCKKIDHAWKRRKKAQIEINKEKGISILAYQVPSPAELIAFNGYENDELIESSILWESESKDMIYEENVLDIRWMIERLIMIMKSDERDKLILLLNESDSVLFRMGSFLSLRHDNSCWVYRLRAHPELITERVCTNEILSIYNMVRRKENG